MKKKILFKYYNYLLQDTYNRTIKHNGFTPCGVCWNNKKSQYIRFDVLTSLLKKFSFNTRLKIADVGCGYAELLNYLIQKNIIFEYEGYDINKQMINYCKKKFFNFNFYLNNSPINYCDVCVMSGTYNYAVTDNIESWESYVIHNLSECLKKSRLGIAFNLQFEKNRNIRNNIYYTNVQYMFSLLRRNFIKIEKYYSYTSSKDIYFLIYKN